MRGKNQASGVRRSDAPDPSEQDTLVNPTPLAEVLSDVMEAYDRGKKFEHCRRIASLQANLLLSHQRTFSNRSGSKASIRTRVCCMLSRSRKVTVSRSSGPFSPRVSKSIVTPNGVPASSCRR